MALPAFALTTVAAVLDELDLEDDFGAVRARIERYIESASRLVATIIGRPLHYDPAIVARVIGQGGVRIFVEVTPVVSITSIDAAGTTVDVGDVIVDDPDIGSIYRSAGWPWTAAAQPGPTYHPAPGTEAPSIVVTYAGGWVTPVQATPELPQTLPEDIADATLELVVSRWKRRGNDLRLSSTTHNSSTYAFGGDPVPPEVMASLSHHQRIGSA